MSAGKRHISKLLDPAKRVWVLAHLFCICIFFVQLFQLLPSYFAPTTTHTEVKEVELEDMNFPLIVKICAKPDFNETALQELGYKDSSGYILGRSKFNGSLIALCGYPIVKMEIRDVKSFEK